MEQEMKVVAAVVRRLRIARGWSQEQLAAASGLSLRTIQRVEAEGTASLSTKTSLAATLEVALVELSEPSAGKAAPVDADSPWACLRMLFLGMAVLMCAAIAESGHLPGLPGAEALAVVNGLLGIMGVAVAAPAAWCMIARGQVACVMLVALAAPTVTLSASGLLAAAVSGRAPFWQLGVWGIGGVLLAGMAFPRSGPSQPESSN